MKTELLDSVTVKKLTFAEDDHDGGEEVQYTVSYQDTHCQDRSIGHALLGLGLFLQNLETVKEEERLLAEKENALFGAEHREH